MTYTSVSKRYLVICRCDLTQKVKSGFKKGFNLNVMCISFWFLDETTTNQLKCGTSCSARAIHTNILRKWKSCNVLELKSIGKYYIQNRPYSVQTNLHLLCDSNPYSLFNSLIKANHMMAFTWFIELF